MPIENREKRLRKVFKVFIDNPTTIFSTADIMRILNQTRTKTSLDLHLLNLLKVVKEHKTQSKILGGWNKSYILTCLCEGFKGD